MAIKHRLASACHLQTNGLTERFNRTLCITLAKYASNHPEAWDTFLPSALFAYRTLSQSTTKYEPFQLMYGRRANLPVDLKFQESNAEMNWDLSIQHHVDHITNPIQNEREQAQ